MRKMASIQKITNIRSIDGADKIELCNILGWQCVIAKKDMFKNGDFVIYVEIDSQMPERPEFEFLRERKFRIRTIKLRGNVSQGLVLPISILPANVSIEEGLDVTEIIGVSNYVRKKEAQEEAVLVVPKNSSLIVKFLMRYRAFRSIYRLLNDAVKAEWPVFAAPKTDEERIQTCAKILMEHYDKDWYITEKLDGQSGTFFTYDKRTWGFKRKCFGVCSRNIWLKTKDNSNYWRIAEKYDLEKKLKSFKTHNITLQGEIVGPSIQKNKYKLEEIDLYVFNVFIDGKILSPDRMIAVCKNLGLKTVPIISKTFHPSNPVYIPEEIKSISAVVSYLVSMAEGDSVLLPRKREGIVIRLIENPRISFKVINPQFLLEENE